MALDMAHEAVSVVVADEMRVGKRFAGEWQSTTPLREYDGVVVQGFSDLEGLTGFVRFSDGTVWSDWHDLYIVRSVADDAFLAGYYGEARLRDARIEFHFEGDGSTAPVLIAAGVFDTRLDADRQGRVEDLPPPIRKHGAVQDVIPPPLVTRAEWNAADFIGTPVPLSSSAYTNMTFHHAAGFRATTLEEGLAQVKAIQDFHQNGRGWSDIGYQFVVDRGGNVYQGRPFLDGSTTLEEIPELSLGAHVGGFNTGNIGICLLGCYHPPEGSNCQDQITDEALESYVTMFAYFGEAYDIPINDQSLGGHRDFSQTACPGDSNYALLPDIRQQAIDVQQVGPDRPEGFAIAPNAPNPFSGETTVRYYLQQDGVVNVTVYNLAGQEVAYLVDEFQEGSRWYRTTFDATGLSSGMYFYQVRVEGFAGEIFSGSQTLVHVR